MQELKIPSKNKNIILALGAESAGNFSVYQNGILHFSEDFGDLLENTNYHEFTNELNRFLKKNRIRPDVVLSDLHPLFLTTKLAEKLAKKYAAEHIPVQHHLAHIFSAIGERIIGREAWNMEQNIVGVACDGTGYGFDGKIWGGEIFKSEAKKLMPNKLEFIRIGHLENQLLIGGDLAIQQPARMLISILSKFLKKDDVYFHIKKYYTKKEFAVLFSQLEQNFNCLETSSTARILDAAAVLLGFSKNERRKKHGPSEALEKNSTKPYPLKPRVVYDEKEKLSILSTTYLFEYLIKNISKDKRRLAATAQKYIAEGLFEIANDRNLYFSGGMANNRIISAYLESKGAYVNKKIQRGDAGISFGQIIYRLLSF